jgi:type III pantothenate kinase
MSKGMILLIDCGNSRVKWAMHGNPSQATERASWPDAEFLAALARKPDRVYVANVAGPEFGARVTEIVGERTGLMPVYARVVKQRDGLHIAYSDPSRLGVDRWLAMIAARSLHGGVSCIVDVGTAMTVDAIDPRGRHLGGLILPGPDLMVASLLAGTSDLVELFSAGGQEQPGYLSDNTYGAIRLGAVQSLAATVDRCVARLQRDFGAPPAVFLTGGAAERILPMTEASALLIPDLVLDGLAVLASEGAV